MIETPVGFRASVTSGLLLPEPLSRDRQVWTRDEWKLLNRAQQLIARKGMRLILKCETPACADAPITKVREGDGFLLRCAHADRVFTKAF